MEEGVSSRRGGALSRTVFRAMGIFGGTQVFSILCGVVRNKLVAVWLGTSGIGLFAIFNSALLLVSGLSQLNLRTSAVRTIATHRDSPRLPSIIYAVRRIGVWLGVAGVAVMLLSAPVFSYRTFGTPDFTVDFMLLSVAVFVLSLAMTEQAALQGLEHLRPLAVGNLRGVGAGLVVSVPLLYFFRGESIVWVIIAYSVTTWLGIRMSRVSLPLQGAAPHRREIWEIGKPVLLMGFYLTLAAVTTELCSYIFIAYLNNAGGTSEVGLFQSGYTLVNRYMGMIFSAIGMEFFPRLASVASSARRTGTFVSHEVLLLTMVMLGVIALFVPLAPVGVRLLYSSEFLGIVPFVILSMPGVVLQGVSWCMAYVMLSRGDGRLYMATEVLSAVVTITFNILFYRYYGLTGVGFSFTAYYAVYLAVIAAVYFLRYRMVLSARVLRTVAGVFAAVTAMTVVALAFGTWWSLAVSVPALAVSAIAVRRLLK